VRVRVLLFVLVVSASNGSAQQLSSAADTLHTATRPVRALGELFIVQLIPFAVNNVIRDKEWARVSLQSWEENLENPWQWDNDHFIANQFGHPYHGNLYFNSARTNGYSFWAAVPWAYGGSAMWELFAEQFAPSANDLLNTGTGGVTLTGAVIGSPPSCWTIAPPGPSERGGKFLRRSWTRCAGSTVSSTVRSPTWGPTHRIGGPAVIRDCSMLGTGASP
jgi:hypothetical protein